MITEIPEEKSSLLPIAICPRSSECGRALVGQSAYGRSRIHRYYVHTAKKGDLIHCGIKRIKADRIEEKIEEHLTEILKAAGHFERIEVRIRELVADSPDRVTGEKSRLESELRKVNIAIHHAFKLQSAVDSESGAIAEVAKELESLSRQKRLIETELEKLKAREFRQEDLEDAISSLKERIAAFQKGWVKASAVTKKSLLKDIIHSIFVGPNGLKIQYRLTHDLNGSTDRGMEKAAINLSGNVTTLAQRRRSSTAETDATSKIHNLKVAGSQVVGNGSEGRT